MSAEDSLIEGGERVSKGKQRESWSEKEIESFAGEYGGDPDADPTPHVGSGLVGIVLFFIILFLLYNQMWDYALYNTILLVVLTLGNKMLN